jgi:hypothetical protein
MEEGGVLTYADDRGCGNPGRVVLGLSRDVLMFLGTALRSGTALVADNLFLRK